MENKDFAVFILTHGRPDNVKTLSTLKKCGYTDTQATFIAIPFDIGKDTIQHWKLIGGVWTKLSH